MSSIPPEGSVIPRPLWEAWRADRVSTPELRRGYARFVRKQPAARIVLRMLRWVIGGLVLGVSLAQAASLARARWEAGHDVLVTRATPPQLQPKIASTASGSTPAPMPEPTAAASGVPHSVTENSTRAAATLGQAYVQQQWQQAAAALRDGDFSRAESAFLQIERGVGGAERDAARLARAQLLASHGRNAEAETLASDLQTGAQSALVREKASALLSKIDAGNRSSRPGAATNQP